MEATYSPSTSKVGLTEDAKKALLERSVIDLAEESRRKDYAHFLTQIP